MDGLLIGGKPIRFRHGFGRVLVLQVFDETRIWDEEFDEFRQVGWRDAATTDLPAVFERDATTKRR